MSTTNKAEIDTVTTSVHVVANSSMLDDVRAMLRAAVTAFSQASKAGRLGDATVPELLSVDIPTEAISPFTYARYLQDEIVPACAPVSSPFNLAHMATTVPPVLGPIAELLASLNQNAVKKDASGILTSLERQTIATMHRLVYDLDLSFYADCMHKDECTLGMSTAGGTLSNLTALWIARNRALASGPTCTTVERSGLVKALGGRRAIIVGSDALHYSVRKAAAILGMGEDGCVRVATDPLCRVRIDSLRETLVMSRARGDVVIAIVGTAGTTDCGSIDPLDAMADVAQEFGIHLHVDAAWGGPLLLSRRLRSQLAGIERADSVTFDGHKMMHLPIANSLLLLRDPFAAAVIQKRAHYMLQEDSGDLGARTVEGSRACASLLMHAALHLIGRDKYERMIDETMRLAAVMASDITARPEFELLIQPMTNIVLYRYLPVPARDRARHALTMDNNADISALNLALQRMQRNMGRGVVSRTIVPYGCEGASCPVTALRAVLSNPDTSEEHIRAVLDEQVRIGDELERR